MNVVIFGATGLIGRGVLLEALDSPLVENVLSIGRHTVDVDDAKLRQIVHQDFSNFAPLATELSSLDACFWCLGTSSAGLDEATYTRITYDFTMAAAKVLHEQSPGLHFCFVSGAGTDSSESGRIMWARVKGKTENAVKAIGFGGVTLFRPAFIRPLRGSKPRGALYRILNPLLLALYPLLRTIGQATSTVEIGRAMIAAAAGSSQKQVLDSPAINRLAATVPTPLDSGSDAS